MMKVFQHAAALAESCHTSPPIDDLKALMYNVLTKNNFTFMDDHYLQTLGLAWEPGWLLPMHAYSCLDLNNRSDFGLCSLSSVDMVALHR